jgi:hypothetical protein
MKWSVILLKDLISLEDDVGLRAADRDSSGVIPVAGSNGIDGYHSEALARGPGIVVGRKGSAGEVTAEELAERRALVAKMKAFGGRLAGRQINLGGLVLEGRKDLEDCA